MGWYEALKDGLKIAQQIDNIELNKTLLELQQQLFEMQEKIRILTDENRKLIETNQLNGKIVRHEKPYITLEGQDKLYYCGRCWDTKRQLVQLNISKDRGYEHFNCFECEMGFSIEHIE